MKYTLLEGDCIELIKTIKTDSIDSIVTDPPYELNFLNKKWDNTGISFNVNLWKECLRVLKPGGHIASFSSTRTYHRMAVAIEDAGFEIRDQLAWIYSSGYPKGLDIEKSLKKLDKNNNTWNGWNTTLKPSWEPICLARKPISGTIADNVVTHGTGAINIGACRLESNRYPANLLHDGSDEVEEIFSSFGIKKSGKNAIRRKDGTFGAGDVKNSGLGRAGDVQITYGDSGSISRFYYCAKATKKDRMDSNHPTIKPVELMKWLVKLITPINGIVLDPFAGSGTTGICIEDGFYPILIEKDKEYCKDIQKRLNQL